MDKGICTVHPGSEETRLREEVKLAGRLLAGVEIARQQAEARATAAESALAEARGALRDAMESVRAIERLVGSIDYHRPERLNEKAGAASGKGSSGTIRAIATHAEDARAALARAGERETLAGAAAQGKLGRQCGRCKAFTITPELADKGQTWVRDVCGGCGASWFNDPPRSASEIPASPPGEQAPPIPEKHLSGSAEPASSGQEEAYGARCRGAGDVVASESDSMRRDLSRGAPQGTSAVAKALRDLADAIVPVLYDDEITANGPGSMARMVEHLRKLPALLNAAEHSLATPPPGEQGKGCRFEPMWATSEDASNYCKHCGKAREHHTAAVQPEQGKSGGEGLREELANHLLYVHPLPWRVGRKVARNVYDAHSEGVAMFTHAYTAAVVVEAVNRLAPAQPAEHPMELSDGTPCDCDTCVAKRAKMFGPAKPSPAAIRRERYESLCEAAAAGGAEDRELARTVEDGKDD